MRSYYGMSRPKYKHGGVAGRRRKRRSIIKVLLIILVFAAIVGVGAYGIGFLFQGLSLTPEKTVIIEATPAAVETPAPKARITDKKLIGTWTVKSGAHKGQSIRFTKKNVYMFDISSDGSDQTTSGDETKYYYAAYNTGEIELMPVSVGDKPGTTIAPDGSDDIYLLKGTYTADKKTLSITINDSTFECKKQVEATPSPTATPQPYNYYSSYYNSDDDDDDDDNSSVSSGDSASKSSARSQKTSKNTGSSGNSSSNSSGKSTSNTGKSKSNSGKSASNSGQSGSTSGKTKTEENVSDTSNSGSEPKQENENADSGTDYDPANE